MKSIRLLLGGILAASTVLVTAAGAAQSGAAQSVSLGEVVVRLGPPLAAPIVIPEEQGLSLKRRTATIAVTYVGFSPEAQAAFQRAVNIWATKIKSSVTIRVHAQWANLGNTGILGSAGPVTFRNCPSNCPHGVVPNTWYPVALASKLSGQDIGPGQDDINAQFNSTFSNWSFASTPAPPGKIDFTSVVLHELGHGLGFAGSGKLINNNTQGTIRALGGGLPTLFDRFTINGANTKLLTFADPSAKLKTVMTNNWLFFRINATKRFKLYAPTVFQPGSSYSHLDEATYPAGDPSSLMTPAISAGETIRDPSPATASIFYQMGWN